MVVLLDQTEIGSAGQKWSKDGGEGEKLTLNDSMGLVPVTSWDGLTCTQETREG